MTVPGKIYNATVMTAIGGELRTIERLQMTDGFTIAPATTITHGMTMKTVRIVNI
ncbi:MAG: hypothetical protein M3O09_07215 [Acidobacteriota bacterium]|nr:hypothetical protein [Acidobacteriota bacterium]